MNAIQIQNSDDDSMAKMIELNWISAEVLMYKEEIGSSNVDDDDIDEQKNQVDWFILNLIKVESCK